MLINMKTPCQKCEKRHIGCHGSCDDYKQFCKEHDELKRKVESEREQFTNHPEKMRLIKKRQMGKR